MYVDSIKIGNTNARAIRTVVDLEAVPTQVFENSPMLIKVGETLYVKNKVVGTIIGTWHLKDTISYATNVGVNFDFVSNDTTYTALLWQNSELHYASQATSEVVVYNESGWQNQAYRTIVIKSGENADLLAFLQASAEKLIDGYYYYSVVSGSGVAFIDITGLDVLPSEYQNEETLKTAILFDTDHLLRLTWIDDMYYFGNTDDFQYRYLSIDTSDWVIMRYDLQEIAKAPKVVNLNTYVPSTATSGTLTQEQVTTLLAHPSNYIQFFNENFYPQDVETSQGYIVYSHVGMYEGNTKIKTITLTIATGGWVLTETSLVSAPISIVNELPEANEENFKKGKIYTTGELLQYISKVALSEPNISQVASLTQARYGIATAAVGTNVYLFGGDTDSDDYITTIQKFDLINNSLTTLSVVLPTKLGISSAVSMGTNIYLFGGYTASRTVSNKIYKFDTINETITTLSTTLANSAAGIGVAVVGTNVYLFGGDGYSAKRNTIQKFDTTTETISTVKTMTQSLAGIGVAAVGKDIYLFGGVEDNYVNTIQKFNTLSLSLETLPTTLPNTTSYVATANIGGSVYLFGGYGGSKLNLIQKFNPNDNTLVSLTTRIPEYMGYIPIVVDNTNVYLFGGRKDTFSFSQNIYKAEFGYTFQYKTIATQ